MNLKDETFVDTLGITSDVVVINQCSKVREEDPGEILSIERITRDNKEGKEHEIVFVESSERGLSKSRNMALENASADICILCDNDVCYVKGYERMILSAYEKHQDADVIVFYIERKEKPVPNFKNEKRMGYYSVLKIFSPEISFRRKSIRDKGISFDPLFGAGAKYTLGEENIFLYDCLKKGLKLYYIPLKIAKLKEVESSWFKGYNRDFFIARGANYRAMTKYFCLPLMLQFAVRKKGLYGDGLSFKEALKCMLEGKKEYEKDLSR